jgi:hypothetical protein
MVSIIYLDIDQKKRSEIHSHGYDSGFGNTRSKKRWEVIIDCTHPKTWEMSRVARKLQARIHGATFLDTSP